MKNLSVNINKIATIRNARGGQLPSVVQAAINAEKFGADGITVHPRPDERHITREDVCNLKKVIKKEFNIEGNPTKQFIDLVLDIKPTQVTLVPDAPDVLTSNKGWDIKSNYNFLKEIVSEFKRSKIRTSIFVDPKEKMVELAKKLEADRVELYTETYAKKFPINRQNAIKDFYKCSLLAKNINIGLNAGHDLNLDNLKYFSSKIDNLLEVSIGHALISDSIYFGLQNTISMYKRLL